MIASRRQWHRRAWIAIAIAVPILILASITVRRPELPVSPGFSAEKSR